MRPRRRAKAASQTAVLLVGFMGAGKTSVGRTLAARLNWAFEDLDDRIVQREGRSVAEVFRDSGEAEFRRIEALALQQVLTELERGAAKVVALGGGAFAQAGNAELIESSGVATVFLDAPVGELWRRCCEQAAASGAERPLLTSEEQFRELHTNRRGKYLRAKFKVQTGARTVEQIASEIVDLLNAKPIAQREEAGDEE